MTKDSENNENNTENNQSPQLQLNNLDLSTPKISESDFFSNVEFKHLPEDWPVDSLCKPTLKALKQMKLKQMSKIQFQSLPSFLSGRDILAAAKTGSGKTLAFLIPIFEVLYKLKFKPDSGIGAIVIAPTRELVNQIYSVAKELGSHHSFNITPILGGTGKKHEIQKIKNGANLLIGTPGRMMDHLKNGSEYMYLKNFKILVLDEADLTLQNGYEIELNEILKSLPNERQTALFSATQTKKIEDLSRMSLKKPVCIGIDIEYYLNDHDQTFDNTTETLKVVKGLEQGFISTKYELRFKFLYSFLKRNQSHNKVMVFMNSCSCAQFFSNLLNFLNIDNNVLHGKIKQARRTQVLNNFRNRKAGVLLCTDVASRGLDIPEVDFILQMEAPLSLDKYVHRVGRTARGENGKGKSLVVLYEHELEYLQELKETGIEEIKEFVVPESKLIDVTDTILRLVKKNYELNQEAKDAFKQTLQAFSNHNNKDVFSIMNLDIKKFAFGFGLEVPPYIDLNSLCLKDPKSKSLRLKRKIKTTEIGGKYGDKKKRHY